jgi:hypothetical protein
MKRGVIMLQSFYQGLKDIILQIFKAVWSIFFDADYGLVWWIIKTAFSYGEWFLLQLANVLGMNGLLSQYSGVITETLILCSKIDRFVPLHESLDLLVLFLPFFFIIISIRIILKFVPFMG